MTLAESPSSPGSVTALVDRLKAGDHEAARLIWERYYPRLVALARKKLTADCRRVADEEDAVVTAFDSFCRRAASGQFPDLHDRDSLWALLVVITARKAADLVRRHQALSRGGGQVHGDSALLHDAERPAGFDALPSDDPTPLEALILAEEVEQLLHRLPDPLLRQVFVRKLEGCSNADLAREQGCSVATIERRVTIIRKILKLS